MISTALIAFAIVALFMGAMLLVFSRKGDARRHRGCALEAGAAGACARCGSMRRADCDPTK
jgi:hypothetical protein